MCGVPQGPRRCAQRGAPVLVEHGKAVTGVSPSVSAFLRRIDDDERISGNRGRRPVAPFVLPRPSGSNTGLCGTADRISSLEIRWWMLVTIGGYEAAPASSGHNVKATPRNSAAAVA